MVRARRWDVTPANLGTPASALPGTPPDADLRYIYDAGDDRVIKTAVDSLGEQVHTLYVFETLEVRRAGWVEVDSGPPQVFDYELTPWTEVPYLFSQGVRLGRIVYEPSSPTIGTDTYHVVLEIGDHLGSTSIAIDRRTGELVERGTYQAYGGADSDYRPERWNEFREDYRFTGKEEDVEVGLQYFGARYYVPQLLRWISPDPLASHSAVAGDLNLYAYVSGQALRATDPLGLELKQTQTFNWKDVKEESNQADLKTDGAAASRIEVKGEVRYEQDGTDVIVHYDLTARMSDASIKYKGDGSERDWKDKQVGTGPPSTGFAKGTPIYRTSREHEFSHLGTRKRALDTSELSKVLDEVGVEMTRRIKNASVERVQRNKTQHQAAADQLASRVEKFVTAYVDYIDEHVVHSAQRKNGQSNAKSEKGLKAMRAAVKFGKKGVSDATLQKSLQRAQSLERPEARKGMAIKDGKRKD